MLNYSISNRICWQYRRDELYALPIECPILGLLHLYNIEEAEAKITYPCVNALSRAYSISTTIINDGKVIGFKGCQCPISGLLHFYKIFGSVDALTKIGVNALSRAYSISTVRSETPHKHWPPEAFFTCNSQNILKITFFFPKIGLFTFCSYF